MEKGIYELLWLKITLGDLSEVERGCGVILC